MIVGHMTALALLDIPHDASNLLRVNNRYIRLSGRVIYNVIVLCLSINKEVGPELFLGICIMLLICVSLWEWIACTENGGKIVEPKRRGEKRE